MELCNHEFSCYPAFEHNFEPVYIYKRNSDRGNFTYYYVYSKPQSELNDSWFFYGTRDMVSGWLFGCVQTANRFVTRKGN